MSIAIDDRFAAVGRVSVNTSDGEVFVYELDSGTLLWTLSAEDPDTIGFGFAVVVSDGIVVVGRGPGSSAQPGGVEAFDAATGTRLYSLQENEPVGPASVSDLFGSTLAAGDGLLCVGSPGAASGGAVFVYELTTGDYQRVIRGSMLSVPSSLTGVGVALDLDRDLLAVSDKSNVYTVSPVTGAEVARMDLQSSFVDAPGLGQPLAISGGAVLIGNGVPQNNVVGEFGAESGFYIADRNPFVGATARFGAWVATSGGVVAVSDPGFGQGIHVFEAGQIHRVVPDPELGISNLGERVAINVAGDLLATGQDFLLNKNAYLFRGVLRKSNSGCPTDTNQDGVADLADLLSVLAEFGSACP